MLGLYQYRASAQISARSLTLLIFATAWAVCGPPQPANKERLTKRQIMLFEIFIQIGGYF